LSFILLIALDLFGTDLRLNLVDRTLPQSLLLWLSFLLVGIGGFVSLMCFAKLQTNGNLAPVSRSTLHITSMVFLILIGATIFSLVFRGFGGDELVGRWLELQELILFGLVWLWP